MTERRNLLPDAFAGAALAYARFRPPYPPALLSDLVGRAGAGQGAILLDLACGPGRVALDLAGAFASVWALDLEPEMVEVGRQEAARRGVDNITWFVGRAEEFEAPTGAFDLITIGEAFHRLDQTLVAEKALGWLKPGGCLATLGGDGVLAGREPWQKRVAEVAQRWMVKAFPGGWGVGRAGAETGPGSQALVLRRCGFTDVIEQDFEEPHDWTCDQISGYLQSTSVCSRKALGEDFDAFEAELRVALLEEAPSLRFHETMHWGYTLGRKPG